MKEIPKEYLVYLQASYKEFETTKEQYLKWYQQNGGAKAGMGASDLASNAKKLQKVPELVVKIPLDDLENGQPDP